MAQKKKKDRASILRRRRIDAPATPEERRKSEIPFEQSKIEKTIARVGRSLLGMKPLREKKKKRPTTR